MFEKLRSLACGFSIVTVILQIKKGLEIITVIPSFHDPDHADDNNDRGKDPYHDKENSDQSVIRPSRFCIRLSDHALTPA